MLLPIAEALLHSKHIIHPSGCETIQLPGQQSGHPAVSILALPRCDYQMHAADRPPGPLAHLNPWLLSKGLDNVDQGLMFTHSVSVFYEMLTGQKTYRADYPHGSNVQQISGPLPSPHQYVPQSAVLSNGWCLITGALCQKTRRTLPDMGRFAKALKVLIESSDAETTLLKLSETLQAQTVSVRPQHPYHHKSRSHTDPITHRH